MKLLKRFRRLRRFPIIILALLVLSSLTMCTAGPLFSGDAGAASPLKYAANGLPGTGAGPASDALAAPDLSDKEEGGASDADGENDGGALPGQDSRRITFLITGIDKVGNNSDVIILAALDIDNNTLKAVQIPRDTYINDEKYGFHKINAVYSFGYNNERKSGGSAAASVKAGNRELKEFIERVLPVRIDRFISVGTDGFVDIVNGIGGVDVDLPFDLDYDDSKQDLHIHFSAGTNHLDGVSAEKFVRFRSGYVNADYGRMDAQKLFLFSMLDKIRHDLSLVQTLSLIKDLYTKVTTDIPALSLLSLVPAGFRLAPENIEMITLKGRSVTVGGTMYEVQNRKYTLDLVNKYLLAGPAELSDLDPEGLLTNAQNAKISGYYLDTAPYGTKAFNATDGETIKKSIPVRKP